MYEEEDDRSGAQRGDSPARSDAELDELFSYLEYLLGHLSLQEFASFLKPLCALSISKTCDACMFAGGIHGYREVAKQLAGYPTLLIKYFEQLFFHHDW